MATTLEKMPLEVEVVKINKVYESEAVKNFEVDTVTCDKIKNVYGDLKFEKLHEDRPYTFTSLVTSIDGRIAFSDAPQGPLISRMNAYGQNGAMADWWVLNLLRTVGDGIMIGAGTMRAEEDFTGHIFDQDLEDARIAAGLNPVPWNIVTSIDGTDIPFEHRMFKEKELPVMISTSVRGLEVVEAGIENDYIVVGPLQSKEDVTEDMIATIKAAQGKVIVIVTGGDFPDSHVAFYLLKKFGIDRLLVETPSYTHYLVGEKLMDELFLNYSCLYIGGKALTIGQFGKEFTSEDHPHTKMLSIHASNDHFFYFRHKLIYN
ncbi:MAG: dihydrofolate reductase family protein [Cellulosilyticaceae bacterium]